MAFDWTTAQTDKVLSTVLDLAKVAFGAIFGSKLTQWQSKRQKRETLERELAKKMLRVRAQSVANDIAGELINLRNFILNEWPDLLESEQNTVVFQKWLNDPTISLIAEQRADGFWTKDKLLELYNDLRTIESRPGWLTSIRKRFTN